MILILVKENLFTEHITHIRSLCCHV